MSEHHLSCHKGTLSIEGNAVTLLANKWIEFYRESIPQVFIDNVRERNGSKSYHITVMTSEECKELEGQLLSLSLYENNVNIDIYDIGLSYYTDNANHLWYITIYSNFADKLRNMYSLPVKHSHITIAYSISDIHTINKDFQSISYWNSIDNLISIPCSVGMINCDYQFNSEKGIILYEHIVYEIINMKDKIPANQLHALKIISKLAVRAKNVILAQDIAYYMLTNGHIFGLRLLFSIHSNIDTILNIFIPLLPLSFEGNHEKSIISRPQYDLIVSFNMKWVYSQYISSTKYYTILTYEKDKKKNYNVFTLKVMQLLRNFSFLQFEGTQQVIAGFSIPREMNDVVALRAVGIRTVITLREEPLSRSLLDTMNQYDINNHYFHVIDRTPPSIDQLRAICDIMHNVISIDKQKVGIHCLGGIGRTNCAIIAYMIKHYHVSVVDAMQTVTSCRKILLDVCQKDRLYEWWTHVQQNSFEVDRLPIPINHLEVESKSHPIIDDSLTFEKSINSNKYNDFESDETIRKAVSTLNAMSYPKILLLCGYAASGKSTFSKILLKKYPFYFTRVNRDEMRGKREVDILFNKAVNVLAGKIDKSSDDEGIPSHLCLIIDMCNLTREKRKEWLLSCQDLPVCCLFFNISLEECKHRIEYRQNHPTIRPGKAGITILDSMSSQLQPPSIDEGFHSMITFNNEDDVNDYLQRTWHIDITDCDMDEIGGTTNAMDNKDDVDKLLKFPRTPHIMNLGAATRDDKVLTTSDIKLLLNNSTRVCIQEKVDGANLGISIDSENKIKVQNRSHYISSRYHAQFHPLDNWIMNHTADIWTILEPGRHILYGEWVYATHSVKYNNLPDWFIAYDIYDRVDKKFFSPARFHEALSQTSIRTVPTIFVGFLRNMDDIMRILDRKSSFIENEDLSSSSSDCADNQHDQTKGKTDKQEGIVIRTFDDNWLLNRCKLVRSDFIAGNERWDRESKLEVNKLGERMY